MNWSEYRKLSLLERRALKNAGVPPPADMPAYLKNLDLGGLKKELKKVSPQLSTFLTFSEAK